MYTYIIGPSLSEPYLVHCMAEVPVVMDGCLYVCMGVHTLTSEPYLVYCMAEVPVVMDGCLYVCMYVCPYAHQ